jgi:penicillin-binding protein 1C
MRRRNRGGGLFFLEMSALGFLTILFIVAGAAALWATVVPIPSIENFESRKVAESTKIYDRTGKVVLFDVYGQIRRTALPLEKISPFIQSATIAIEDDEFYTHRGFRPLSFMRAMWVNIKTGSFAQGGSTITQQVVKNTLLTQKKSPLRKLEDIFLAIRLEQVYTKEQILSTYLNETSYGGTIYGVEEASQYFFGKSASEVTLAEAAYLAALPQAPTRLSPHGQRKHLLDARQKLVLQKMYELTMITKDEYDAALEEVVVFRPTAESGIKAPHFVFFVREYLEEKYGADAVAQGGLRVITTLDWDLQQKAEEVVKRVALENEKNYNAENAGFVAIEPGTGQIIAMVGSRDYFDPEIDGMVNVATTPQQPGSAMKPFVYAAALKRGYTPETIVFDLRTQFSTICSPTDTENNEYPCFSPVNYDGIFRGPVTLRNALAQSINVPAVKTLYLAGLEPSVALARSLGMKSLTDAAQYGLSLVLGSGEVTLLEITGAYAGLANEGELNPPAAVLRVESRAGEVLEQFEKKSEVVLEANIARTMADMLSDNEARTPAFGAASALYFPGRQVAAKTGTTNDYRDAWILGYTRGVAAGAWAGNNDNSPMEKRVAGFIVAPMWHEIMEYAIEKYPGEAFTPPAPEDSSTLPAVLRGNWNGNPAFGVHDILHWVSKSNPRVPGSSTEDSQYYYWEYPVLLWATAQFAPPVPQQPMVAPTFFPLGAPLP